MLEISIKTTKSTEDMLKKFPDDIRNALFEAMRTKVGPFLERTVKRSFGKNPYPMVRTGNLRRSIYNKALKRASNIIGIVGSNVIYASFLEEGTSKMKPKPFLYPAVDKNETRLSKIITDHIAMRMNK